MKIPKGVFYASIFPLLYFLWLLGVRTRGLRRLIWLSLISLGAGFVRMGWWPLLFPLEVIGVLEFGVPLWMGGWLGSVLHGFDG